VDVGQNMAGVAILGGVTWHTSNVSVIEHTMSGGPNNLLFGLLTETLSGSHGHSLRIRHEKLPEAPTGGEITMTSYPAIRKSCSVFQNPS